MAYLKKVTNKVGKVYFLSLIQDVKHVGSKYISLDTDNKGVAEVRHSDVGNQEVNIKNGQQVIFPWASDTGGKSRVVLKTIGECVEEWLDMKYTNLREQSVRRYAVSLNAFMSTLKSKENEPIRNIKNKTIEDFKKAYKGQHTNAGININLRGVKAFLRWVCEEEYLENIPKIVMMPENKEKPKYLTEMNWVDLINLESVDDWWKNVWKLYYSTGLRRGEPVHGYLDDEFLIVPAEFCKAKIEIEVYLLPWQINIVQQLHVARDKHLANGSDIVTFKNRLNTKFTDACKKIGIYKPNQTTLHCLRHTFALMKYLECRDLNWVSVLLHHGSLKVTRDHYACFTIRRLKKDFPTYWKQIQKVQKMAQTCDMATPFVATPSHINYNPRLLN